MDPILPEVQQSPQPHNDEVVTTPAVNSYQGPESAPNVAPEQPHEGAPVASPTQAPQQPVTAVAVDDGAQAMQGVASQTPSDDNPLIADDVDVIEKEWVEKAKKIVGETKNDPYQQEKQVSQLQADYLMKRYSKQVKIPE